MMQGISHDVGIPFFLYREKRRNKALFVPCIMGCSLHHAQIPTSWTREAGMGYETQGDGLAARCVTRHADNMEVG